MGSNIHIVKGNKELPMLPFPEDLVQSDSCTCPRWVGSSEFMRLVYDDSERIPTCGCGDKHDYYCMYDTKYRPKNLEQLRQAAKDAGLQDCFQQLIDYLESEPNAWLEYD